MTMNKYISVVLATAALATASSAFAVDPCVSGLIPSGPPGITVPCGTLPGPKATGKITYNGAGLPAGSFISYSITLNSGISSAGLPVANNGTSSVAKQGGGTCPAVNAPPVPGVPSSNSCTLATNFSAKRYRVTVG